MTEYDYSDYQPERGDNEFARLSSLAEEQAKAEAEVARLEAELEAAKQHLRTLSEGQVPELMQELGQEYIRTPSGVEIEIKEIVRASIPKARRPEAVAWLEQNGYSGLVNRKFEIVFNKDEEAWARKFQRDLAQRKKPVNATIDQNVHHSRLTSWVKSRLEEGVDIPLDLFGVYRQRVSKVKK